MKKLFNILALILVLCQLFILTSCGCKHIWNQLSDTATCVKDGKRTFYCSLCDKTKTEKSYATGKHNWNEIADTATCVEDGEKTFLCYTCGTTITEKSYARGNHSFELTGKQVEPTVYVDGYVILECSVCGMTKQLVVRPKLLDVAENALPKVIEEKKSSLIDPYSVKYDVECYTFKPFWGTVLPTGITPDNTYLILYKVHFNAKNYFGAYVGYHDEYYIWDSYAGILETISAAYYNENIDKFIFTKSN